MRGHACVECGKGGAYIPLPHGRICIGCKRRTHYHQATCPGCGDFRPLGYRDENERTVCASCAGQESSIFACPDCGREDHPYGSTRCARCILRQRLTELLTDPGTGGIAGATAASVRHAHDVRAAANHDLLAATPTRDRAEAAARDGARADGDQPRRFRDAAVRPSPHYLRDLLAAVGVLPPYEPAIARMTPWLAAKLEGLPADEARLLNRFARWRVLRRLRGRAERGELTKAMIDRGRVEITEAVKFLGWARQQGVTIDTVSQAMLDRYFHAHPSKVDTLCTFLNWLPARPAGLEIELPSHRQAQPMVTDSDEDRWVSVELLLHDESIRVYVRIARLFTLLFAQPLTSICRMRSSQADVGDEQVLVTFDREPVETPPPASTTSSAGHLGARGNASYASRDNGWLFPGGIPGRPLQTENVRAQLVELGIKPHDNRKTALFQLAATIPTPVLADLADLVGIAPNTAVRWAALTSRSWSAYIAQR